MNLSCRLWVFLLLLLPSIGMAKDLTLGASLGYPSFNLKNLDGEKVYYDGIAVLGQAEIPILYSKGGTGIGLDLGVKYFDLNNTANSDTQLERSNHLGPFVGLRFELGKLVLTYAYDLMKTRTYWVGDNINNYKEFDYTGTTLAISMGWDVSNRLKVGLGYSTSTATFEKSNSGLSDDVNINGSTIWLNIEISTGQSFGQLGSKIFSD